MAILALEDQKRGHRVGEIRMGTTVNGRPVSLDKFRITTRSERLAGLVANRYGGKPNPTVLANKEPTIEVMTETKILDVVVPPRDAVISQWRELWGNGFCQRRCDSVTEKLSQSPCKCPADEEERRDAVKEGTACKDITRLSLMLPDITIGVWKVVTGSINAALELSDSTDILGAARKQKIWLPATFELDRRIEKKLVKGKPQTFKFPVGVLLPVNTPREIASGQITSGFQAALPPSATAAIGAGTAKEIEAARPSVSAIDESDEVRATGDQKAFLNTRIKKLTPAQSVTFNNWVKREKSIGGIRGFGDLRVSDLAVVSAKLDVITGIINEPEVFDQDHHDDNVAVDAEIVEESMFS